MNESARELSLTLDSVARAIAQWTVTRHAELDPSLEERYGEGWRRRWVADTEMRVRHLAQAIAVRRPQLMTETVAWARMAHAARGLDASDIDTNTRSLRDILAAELPEPVRDVALEYTSQALEESQRAIPANGAPLTAEQPHSQLTLRYLEAVLEGRSRDAESIVLDAVDGGLAVRDVYIHVLTPAQSEIGRMWHRGEVSVADEHAATMTAETIMSMLRPRFRVANGGERRLLATAVGGDLHSIGVRMVADFFEMDGWWTLCLGANMPAADVVQAVVDHEIDLLAISASSNLHVRAVGDLIDAVRGHPELAKVGIVVGGFPFIVVPDLWRELEADGFAATADEAVALGNRLVTGHRTARPDTRDG